MTTYCKINGDDYKKTCKTCKKELTLCDFYVSRNLYDGHMNNCITCHRKLKKPTLLDKIRSSELSHKGF